MKKAYLYPVLLSSLIVSPAFSSTTNTILTYDGTLGIFCPGLSVQIADASGKEIAVLDANSKTWGVQTEPAATYKATVLVHKKPLAGSIHTFTVDRSQENGIMINISPSEKGKGCESSDWKVITYSE